MRNSSSKLRAPLLVLWATLLSLFTALLGAAPLRVYRLMVGRAPYWLTGALLVVLAAFGGAYFFTLMFGTIALLVGIHAEFEEREFTLRQSAGFSILLTSLLLSSGFYVWATLTKGWFSVVTKQVSLVFEKARELNLFAFNQIQPEDIVVQLPSAVFVFLVLSLGLAFIFEKPIARWAGIRVPRREKLSDFALPDFVVWLFIIALLGSFGQFGLKAFEKLALNLLNITVILYFFQGLAVLGKYFDIFRVGLFWRFMWVMILVVQLPLLMAIVGLVDYWADFRKMFVKKAADLKKKSIQE